jgi:hypothetical protein
MTSPEPQTNSPSSGQTVSAVEAQLLQAVSTYVQKHLRNDPEMRAIAQAFGEWLVAQSRDVAAPAGAPVTAAPAKTFVEQRAPASGGISVREQTADETGRSVSMRLVIGDASAHVPVRATAADMSRISAAAASSAPLTRVPPTPPPDDHVDGGEVLDLALIEQRCQLKAESCRLYIERRAAAMDPVHEPALIERVNALIAKAKATKECFLWVLWRERTQPNDDTLRMLATCYEALGACASLLNRLTSPEGAPAADMLAEAMQSAAEASSALRAGLTETWLPAPDRDQDEMHLWLRRETAGRQIFVPRYMRRDDPADPAEAPSLLRHVLALRERVEARLASQKQVRTALQQLSYHAPQLVGADEAASDHHLRKIFAALHRLTELNVSADDPRLRSALPDDVLDLIPIDQVADEAVLSLLESLRAARVQDDDEAEATVERAPSPRVAQVRALIANRSLVIIGGVPRENAIRRLREAFQLANVEWVHLTEHGRGEPMRAPIFREETAAVLVLIKLTGHLHAEHAAEYARQAGKPCVLLKAGYNPEQVAEAMLMQAGVRLGQVPDAV